jgi:5-methyltetrahydropteroyltriglutamate--homocysteine methyltransferase
MTAPLQTSVVGSHARPGWFVSAIAAADRGELGPDDLRELYDDAVDIALRDQEDAGVDVVSDGEMRRAGFFTAEFYRHLTGVEALPPDRRLGAGGHDQQHRFRVTEPIAAPDGLGVVAEYRAAVTRTTRALKVTIPGPYTLSGRLRTGPGEVYAERQAAAEAFVPILRSELEALVVAGARIIQIDDPSPAIHPDAPSDFAALFNAAVEPVVGKVRLGAHLCFGNYEGRPLARRTYRPVLDAMLAFRVDELVLEFANRELAELELLAETTAAGRDVAAGLVDVKSYHLETADEVAERIDAVLATGVPAERLTVVPDCGFSQTARWATVAKLRAMVAGRDLVLGRTSR